MEEWKKERMRLVNQLEDPVPNVSSEEIEWNELIAEYRKRGITPPDFYDFWETKNLVLVAMQKTLGISNKN